MIRTGMVYKDEENMLWEIILTTKGYRLTGLEIPTGYVDMIRILNMKFYGVITNY